VLRPTAPAGASGGAENRGHFPRRRPGDAPHLIERAVQRARNGAEEGRPPQRISFADVPVADLATEYDPTELLSLEAAIDKLGRKDGRAAEVVRLRFYGGLDIEETAEVLGVVARTVKRDWTFAKAWLLAELEGSPEYDPQAQGTRRRKRPVLQ
jgi:DNA-directed RNA polymerase specialized sigma24 family protein